MNFGIGNGFTKIQVKFVIQPNPMYNYAMATLLRQSQAFSVPLFPLVGNVFAAAAFTIAVRWCWRQGVWNGEGCTQRRKRRSRRNTYTAAPASLTG